MSKVYGQYVVTIYGTRLLHELSAAVAPIK
jgi:hypothetical protein